MASLIVSFLSGGGVVAALAAVYVFGRLAGWRARKSYDTKKVLSYRSGRRSAEVERLLLTQGGGHGNTHTDLLDDGE